MNVSLTPEFDAFIQQKVQSGLYQTASEVVREALRLLKERDELHQRRIEQLQSEIQRGLAQAEKGQVVDAETAYRQLFSES